jgi:hypothetical protein
MTLAQKKALIASLASVGKVAQNPKRWAEVLRDKEQGGSYLTRVQRDAWRQVLGDPSKQDAA